MNTKRLALFLLCAMLFPIMASAARQPETILRGTVIDAAGEPAGFATAYITAGDGAIVCGTTADDAGRFELRAAYGEYTLTVSLVGYKDASQHVTFSSPQMELPPIRIEEDSELLGEAVIKAVMPKTTLTGEGLSTSVRGSVLENAGTARDVLGKVPGLIKGQNGLEVIGKGAPVVYINGRRITDSSELDRLLSHEIQSIEVISNPGAQYDATVRAVVRIKTIKRQGEGFGFNANLTDAQSLRKKDNNDRNMAFNANYRTGGVDIFGGVNADKVSERQISDVLQKASGKHAYGQEESLVADFTGKSLGLNGGVNWQIADNHFAGFKLDWNSTRAYHEDMSMDGDIFLDGTLLDRLHTESTGDNGAQIPYSLGANVYYNGTAGKLGIDFNADYFGVADSKVSEARETSDIQDGTVDTRSTSGSRLYAGKLVLSYPVWAGQLQLGTEETFSRRSDEYSLRGASVPASSSVVREDNYAGFVNYAFMLGGIGQMSAGLRYEHVDYSYEDLLAGQGSDDSFTRRYDKFFPSVSFATAIGPVQTMLSYSARTARPDFSMLSSAVRYDNRYTLQSGNAALQPQSISSLSAAMLWNFLSLSVSYDRTDDPIITWAGLYNDEGVILLKPLNLEQPLRMLSAFLSATPTIGPWSPSYVFGVQQNWLTVDVKDPLQPSANRSISFSDKPIWIAQLNNTFSLKKNWQFELGGEYHSPGYAENVMVTNHFLNVTAAVQKSLLRDGSLVLRLEGQDLAGLGHNDIFTDLGTYSLKQSILMDSKRLMLSVRYRFNSADSKYKGTGAGKDARDRMR